MRSELSGSASGRTRRRPALAAGAGLAVGAALLIALSPLPGSLAHIPSAQRSGVAADLSRMTALADRRLRPPAARLGKALPADRRHFGALREPAATVQAQLGIALDELRQMNALAYDPHYLPALLAVGRAHLAATGQDPVTRTSVDPEFAGLEGELAEGTALLGREAKSAGRLAREARRLSGMLRRARRRARRLERRLTLMASHRSNQGR